MAIIEPSREQLKELFNYEDGSLIWRHIAPPNYVAGQIAGSEASTGYLAVSINAVRYGLHRLIYIWHHGDIAGVIDHRDRDNSNNRIENLRDVPQTINRLNSSAKGASWHKPSNKYRAYIKIGGRQISLGYFHDEQEAIQTYQAVRRLRYPGAYHE